MSARFIVTGGGTSGHINPALAIAGLLKDYYAKRGEECELIFTGRQEGLEGELVPKAGYEFKAITAMAMPLKPSMQFFKALIAVSKGRKQCMKIIKEFKPDAVISTGGYVSAPLLYAAKSLKVPVMIHEANAFPGRANKVLSKGAALVMTGFPDQEKVFSKAKLVRCTGNPVREIMFGNTYEASRQKLGLKETDRMVFTMGGSLGAKTLTNFILKTAADERFADIKFVLSAGKHNAVELPETLPSNLEVMSYIDEPNVYLSGSDVCILRAGAVTCAEITATGACAIMVPYPHAAHDHQTYNANMVAEGGGGIVISDADVEAGMLTDVLLDLLSDNERRQSIRQVAHSKAVCDTNERIIKAVMEALEKD